MVYDGNMAADEAHPYRAPPLSRPRAPSPLTLRIAGGSKLASAFLAALVVIAAWLALIAWHERALTRAVHGLPPAVQEATFRRTYEELTTTCAVQPALADHCSDQAQFLLRFPQCDAACEQLARRHFPIVTK